MLLYMCNTTLDEWTQRIVQASIVVSGCKSRLFLMKKCDRSLKRGITVGDEKLSRHCLASVRREGCHIALHGYKNGSRKEESERRYRGKRKLGRQCMSYVRVSDFKKYSQDVYIMH